MGKAFKLFNLKLENSCLFFTNKSHSVLVSEKEWIDKDFQKLTCEDSPVINSQTFLKLSNQTHVSDQLYVKVNRERVVYIFYLNLILILL